MKMKKWLKCLLMTMALMMVVNVGAISTTIPAAAKASAKTIKVGTKFQSGKFQYKVTSLSGDTGTATLIGTKSKKLTSVNVPETVKKGKYTLTVDAIGDNAFKNCKKLKSVATNTKIKKIGKNAFKGCKKLTAVNIKSAELKSVGKNALKGISKQAVVTAPAGTADSYEDMLGVDVEAPAAAAQVFAARSVSVPKPVVQTEKAPQTEAPSTEAPKAIETEATETESETELTTEAAETEALETEPETELTTEAAETEALETEPETELTTEAAETEALEAKPETELATEAMETEALGTEPETELATKAAETEALETELMTEASEVETPTPKRAPKKASAPRKAPETEAPEPETAHQHSYGDWMTVVEATCTTAGTEERICTNSGCDAKETRTVAAKGHTLGEWEIEPLPTGGCYGRNVRKCTSCDYVEKSNSVVHRTDILQHPEDIPATCTTSGKKNRVYCPICRFEDFGYVRPLGHDYSNEVTTEEGTCVKPGLSYRKCKREGCDAKVDVKEIQKAEGHQWVPYTLEATCTKPGFEGQKCEVCGTEQGKEVAPLGHKYEVTTIAATCTQDGRQEETCSVCGDTKVTTIPSSGQHQWVNYPEEEATCAEDGHSAYIQCAVCGVYQNNTEPKTYAATGKHRWVTARATRAVPADVCSDTPEDTCVGEEMTMFKAECGDCHCYYIIPGNGLSENTLKDRAIYWIAFISKPEWEDADPLYSSHVCLNGEKYACFVPTMPGSAIKGGMRFKIPTAGQTYNGESFAGWEIVNPTSDEMQGKIWLTEELAALNFSGTDIKMVGKTFKAVYGSSEKLQNGAAAGSKKRSLKRSITETGDEAGTAPEMQSASAQTMPVIEDGPYIEEPASETETETETETEHVCEFDWVVTKEPYCGYLKNDMTWRDTGSRTGTCKVCGKVVKEGLRAEHQLVVTKDMEPTCTTRGATYSKCMVCGYESISFKDEDGNIREALGHNMKHHEDPATCTEDGRSYDECSRCGLVQNDQVTTPKLGHDFTPETVTEGAGFRSVVKDPKEAYIERAPSCTLVGVEKIPCQHDDCGVVKTQYISATGHDLKTEEIAATCSTNKKIVTTCEKCDYKSTKILDGTKLPHQLVEEEIEPSTTTEHGYVRKVCTVEGCNYAEKDITSLAKKNHTWVHVSGEEKDREGALASMSYEHRIRTEYCSVCHELRYAYHLSTTECEKGKGDYYTNCKDDGHWVGWEEVPCSTKGHTWMTEEQAKKLDGRSAGHVYCTVCGAIKPESAEKSDASRIVWSVHIKTKKGEDEAVDYDQPTAISSAHNIEYPAPEIGDGYTFDRWTWSKGDREENEISDGTDVFDGTDKSKLKVSCDYMNVTFTAHYRKADSVAETSAPAGTTQTIHGTMEIDLGLGDGSPAATHEHEVEEHHETLHEGENMTEMPSAPAEAGTESPILEETVTE